MILLLKSDPEQERALEVLAQAQQDPTSPAYHQWLTPSEYGQRFGVADEDLEKVLAWLQSYGFVIDEIPASRQAIVFSGTASQVEAAFDARMSRFNIDGEEHIANGLEPQIPEALVEVVGGVVSLHDFRSRPMHHMIEPQGAISTMMTSGSSHYLAPADFATIYNTAPLLASGVDGAGRTIAIVGRSQMRLSDVAKFRSDFGLPANPPIVIVNGADPGIIAGSEESEAALDVQWAGAAAPGATIKFVVSKSTSTSDGVALSAQYIVNNAVGEVVSVSFGLCEAAMGSAYTNFWHNLWRQATTQGMTVFVSSGDSGAAGCDPASAVTGTRGRGVNGLCSSPYAVCVGGTEFADTSNPSLYWSSTTDPTTKRSALGYIPEAVWNDSGSSGLWSTGGGVSIFFTRPSYQNGVGEPAGEYRLVPDVSLAASARTGYLTYVNSSLMLSGGTSASAPALAGIMALVNARNNTLAGNANTRFYPLAAWQHSGGPAIFHDIVTGTNSVSGVSGFSAGPRYDLSTGLGTVDAHALASRWLTSPSTTEAVDLTLSPATLTLQQGASGKFTVLLSSGGAADCTYSIAIDSAPAGVDLSRHTVGGLCAPGSRVVPVSIGTAVPVGTYQIPIIVSNNGKSDSGTLTLVVTSGPTFTITSTTTSLNLPRTTTPKISFALKTVGGFSASTSLSLSGLPSGVTATLSPASLAAPGSGTITATLTVSNTAPLGSYEIVASATGGGITKILRVPVTVLNAPDCTVQLNPASLSVAAGEITTAQISCTSVEGAFNSGLALAATGAPLGVTAKFSPTLIYPGGAGSTFTVTTKETATPGPISLTISVTARTGTWIRTLSVPVEIKPANTFRISAVRTAMVAVQGESDSIQIVSEHSGLFNAPVTWSISTPPAGVSASFTPATLSAPGSGTTTLRIAPAVHVLPGNYSFTVTATGGTVVRTLPVKLRVNPPPSFTVTQTVTQLAVNQGSTASFTVKTKTIGTFDNVLSLSATLDTGAALPSGVTASFLPPSIPAPGTGSSVVTFQAATNAQLGTYNVKVTLAGGGLTRTALIALVVQPPATFQLTSSLPRATVVAGAAGSVKISTAGLYGFNSPVTLAAGALPAGVTATLSATSISGAKGVSTVSFAAAEGTTAGVYTVRFTASGSGVTKTVDVELAVYQFAIQATPSPARVARGTTRDIAVTVTTSNTNQDPVAARLSAVGLPLNVTGTWSVVTGTGGFGAVLRLTAKTTAVPGSQVVTLRAVSGTAVRTIPITVIVE